MLIRARMLVRACCLVAGTLGVSRAYGRVGIIDAGSTGTRLSVYSVRGGRVGRVDTTAENTAVHGLDGRGVARLIRRLLVKSSIPVSVPVGFYGTAGLRSVGRKKRREVLEGVRAGSRGYSLRETVVLTGGQEALYMLKAFESLLPQVRRYILVDMGGKSVQTVRRTDGEISVASKELGLLDSHCRGDNRAVDGVRDRASGRTADDAIFGNIGDVIADKEDDEPADKKGEGEGASENDEDVDSHGSSLSSINSLGSASSLSGCAGVRLARAVTDKIKQPGERFPIFLFSVFRDIFGERDSPVPFGELSAECRRSCQSAAGSRCEASAFLLAFLSRLGILDSDTVYITHRVNGHDLTWSYGKALELAG